MQLYRAEIDGITAININIVLFVRNITYKLNRQSIYAFTDNIYSKIAGVIYHCRPYYDAIGISEHRDSPNGRLLVFKINDASPHNRR